MEIRRGMKVRLRTMEECKKVCREVSTRIICEKNEEREHIVNSMFKHLGHEVTIGGVYNINGHVKFDILEDDYMWMWSELCIASSVKGYRWYS